MKKKSKKTFQLLFVICVSCITNLLYSQSTINMENTDSIITLVVTSTANQENLSALKAYVKKVMPMLLTLKGEVIKRSKIIDIFNGKKEFDFLLIMDFPSKNALLKMFNSSAYQSLIPDRNKGFISINILLAKNIE